MTVQSRVEFPGFVTTKTADTGSHQVEIGNIIIGGVTFVLEMIRNKSYDFLPFAVASVSDTAGKKVWAFKGSGHVGVGVLALAGDEVVVALQGSGRDGKVERVVPFSSFAATKPVGMRAQVRLKKLAAEHLERDYHLTSGEQKMLARDSAERKAAEEAEDAERRRLREEAREVRTRALLARGRATAYTADGTRRTGIPVLEAEWPMCSNGTYVIVVASISEDGTIGEPIEAFKVVKERGGNPKKGERALVTAVKPATVEVEKIKPLGTIEIDDGDDVYEVLLFGSMDDIRQARKEGLNGGAYVAVNTPKDGKYAVLSVRKDGVDTVGNFAPIG